MRDQLLKVADVLEKAAALIDAHEAEKQAAVKRTRAETIKVVSEKWAAATGDELPQNIREKLAAGDDSVLAVVQEMTEKTAGTVESLGRSSERPAESKPVTKEERKQAAYSSFGRFITS